MKCETFDVKGSIWFGCIMSVEILKSDLRVIFGVAIPSILKEDMNTLAGFLMNGFKSKLEEASSDYFRIWLRNVLQMH